ncbi:hypothetical protein AX17_001880 [Amanita inopinata Kibby_2008]|nr:hypothetical protein AX17_001880 [Amanita inopinata Kibby_2008]
MEVPAEIYQTTHELDSQVGGHKGVLTTEDSSLIIKPALPLEVGFYQTLSTESVFIPLRPFIPTFLGTLKLEGKVIPEDADVDEVNIDPPEKKESIVLENLAYRFLRPNILDMKLGTVLYDEEATPQKRERMIEVARKTTSFETGIRLTGFQVYDNETKQPVVIPKSYGKSIRSPELPNGIARFFPVGSKQEADPGLGPPSSPSGLPLSSLLAILHGIKDSIMEIRQAVASLEMRMVGSSLLIIYESDWDRAEEAIKQSLIEGEDEEGEDEEDSDDGQRIGPPYIVRLIDFAHTRITPGRGADEGVLTGLDTALGLIDGRIKELVSA